ncbi:MAG TPA: hypothetical protein VFA56_08385 [Gaiellaceae bacterium]|nr:hypothetical protein [Gaiellaceae bacterium]
MRHRPTNAAHELYACACAEAGELSFAVTVEHLVLACARLGSRLDEFVEADEVRELILLRERDALARVGISYDSVREEMDDALRDSGCLPIAPEVKRLLERAARRRRRVEADVLLRTLVEESATARAFLAELDVPIATLRSRLRA